MRPSELGGLRFVPRVVTGPDGRPGPSAGLRLLAVHAHPDDESSKGAPSLAMYLAEGAEVVVATCTGGERGDVLNPALQEDPQLLADLPKVRREEMARAIEALGVDHVWLGFVDSGLPEGDPLPPLPDGCFALQPIEVAAEPLVRLIRQFKPHVITTYDENGGYPHPDHIMCHRVSVEAFEAAGDPQRYPDAGEPWQPQKLYYNVSFHYDRFAALHAEMERRGLESPYGERLAQWEHDDRKVVPVTTNVDCADYLEIRDRALLAHATQVDPNGHWFAVPLDVQQVAWPTDDYHLARSHVEVELPEADLFAGVRDRIEAPCT
ncbi:MAG: mycothiol conjugate amidase Mca [Streptosporangiales bacterium]|nr:mycothiol conjugate amidase Mca [Streptosporangiales bacterium]